MLIRKHSAFKVVIVGDAGVGKSSLITRFVDGTFVDKRYFFHFTSHYQASSQ